MYYCFYCLFIDRPQGINSSIIIWHSHYYCHLYEFLVLNYTRLTLYIHKFDYYLEMMLLLCDESNEARRYIQYIQDIVPGMIIDYHHYLTENNNSKAVIVCFPLSPKPHELAPDSALFQYWNRGS